MKPRVRRAWGKCRVEGGGIGEVAWHQPRARQRRRAVAGRQIVQHHAIVAALKQGGHDMAADEAGAAGHKVATSHALSSCLLGRMINATIWRGSAITRDARAAPRHGSCRLRCETDL